jgi:hypothetical protein
MSSLQETDSSPVPAWFERAGRLMIGLYFLLPCLMMTARLAVGFARGESLSVTAVPWALVFGIMGALAIRGRFVVPLVFMVLELVLMMRGALAGAATPRWEIVADSSFLVLALGWLLLRRIAAGGSWTLARKSICAALAVAFLAWTVSFATRLGEGIALLAAPQPARDVVLAGQRFPLVEFVDHSGIEEGGGGGAVEALVEGLAGDPQGLGQILQGGGAAFEVAEGQGLEPAGKGLGVAGLVKP